MTTDTIDGLVGHLGQLPVFFIAGLPRSGTTWLQQLMNAHPEVLCLGESHYVNELVPSLYKVLSHYTKTRARGNITWAPGVVGPQPPHMGPIFRAAFAALAAANIGEKDPARLVTVGEKTPDNLYNSESLWRTFPQARIIHIIRDPRDGAVSGYARFRSRLPEDMTMFDYVNAYSTDWVRRINKVRRTAEGRPYFELRYEDLHADVMGWATRVFAYVGAATDEASVRAAVDAASFETLSGGRKRGEKDQQSHYRRGEVESWRDELTAQEAAIAERNAAPLMAELGYPLVAGGNAPSKG